MCLDGRGRTEEATRDHGGTHRVAGSDFHSWGWRHKGKRTLGAQGPEEGRYLAGLATSEQRLEGKKGQGWVVVLRLTWLGLV